MSEIIEAIKVIIKKSGNLSEDEIDYWKEKTAHCSSSFRDLIANVMNIYENGFQFRETPLTGGKGTVIPRICKELELGIDGRHRVAMAYVLGAEEVPVVIHTTDRDFDDGSSALQHAAQLIEEFYQSPAWDNYKQGTSYRLLVASKDERDAQDLDQYSRLNAPSLPESEGPTREDFLQKLRTHPKLQDMWEEIQGNLQ